MAGAAPATAAAAATRCGRSMCWSSRSMPVSKRSGPPIAASPRPAAQRPAPPPRTPRAAPAADDEDAEDIVVTGSRRPPGSAIGDIPPEITLNQGDIRSYGVGSVTELLTQLAPQTGSGQG